jgi:tetratricopeptide (TPR) repeat protein
MSRSSNRCDRALTVNRRIVDGKNVTGDDQTFVAGHLAECENCRVDAAVHRVYATDDSPFVKDELNRRRMISDIVMRAEIEDSTKTPLASSRHQTKRIVTIGLSLAAAAACAAAVFAFISPDKPQSDTAMKGFAESEPSFVDSSIHPTAPKTDPVPQRAWATLDKALLVQPRTGISILLEPHSHIALEGDENGPLKVRLSEGALLASVDPHRKDRRLVSVLTDKGMVTVKGTVFRVTTTPGGGETAVLRGAVIVALNNKETTTVAQGTSLSMSGGAPQGLTVESLNALSSKMELLSQLESDQGHKSSSEQEVLDTSDSSVEKTAQASVRNSNTKEVPYESISKLLAEAGSLRRQGDYLGAKERYVKLISKYPSSEETLTASVTLGTIELRKLNEPKDALRHFEYYLKSKDTTLRREALLGKADAYLQLGFVDEERQMLERYIRDYPDDLLTQGILKRMSAIKK